MFQELLLDENIGLYEAYYNRARFRTIHHHPQHLLAEEKAESGRTYFYLYEEGGRFALLPSVKRRINDIDVFRGNAEEYFDLITPYDYSGLLSDSYDLELFKRFYRELEAYCIHHQIVFHFIRFNPYSEEYKAAEHFNVRFSDDQNWIDCTGDAMQGFKKRTRLYVRAAIKTGVKCKEVDKTSENVRTFSQCYIRNMDRLQARKSYYFNIEYFLALVYCEFSKLFFVTDGQTGKILSGTIVICDKDHKRIYYHLSFRKDHVESIRPMEYMLYALVEWAKAHGYDSIHLGGGSQSLHGFKDKFTDKRVPYYCGNMIYLPEIYQMLSKEYFEKYPSEKDSLYLPIFRSKE